MTAEIYFALPLVAAGFAVPGWLLDRPDGARRYRSRFACASTLTAAIIVSTLRKNDLWSLWWWFSFACAFLCGSWASREYRRLEAARKVERLMPWKRS